MTTREDWVAYIHDLQNHICSALEAEDGKAVFQEDSWMRDGGGGRKTRVIANGNVIEKGGVNTSVVYGDVTDVMRAQLKMDGKSWFACGLSLVLHPVNPFVPTVHCNYRMFELYDDGEEVKDRWFGGGTDLTPSYLYDEDAIYFHGVYKKTCDQFDPEFYKTFKGTCDQYFVNIHRNNESRGIGGIFYDYQRPSDGKDVNFWMNFGKACGDAFIPSYLPLVQKRKNIPFSDANKHWQEIRRGRYTEFNLVYDRGTLFGLKTNGRTESILMSLPPTVRFEYNYQPQPGSDEERLQQVLLHPREWV